MFVVCFVMVFVLHVHVVLVWMSGNCDITRETPIANAFLHAELTMVFACPFAIQRKTQTPLSLCIPIHLIPKSTLLPRTTYLYIFAAYLRLQQINIIYFFTIF